MAFILSGFIVFGKGFIEIWAGYAYSESYIITLIFFVALFIPLIQNTGVSILQARNQMKFRSLLYLVISLVSLAFQVILAKRMGAVGCAISIGGALVLGQGLVMNIYYSVKQHLDIRHFWNQILRMILGPVVLTVVGIISCMYLNYTRPLVLIGGIIMFTALYAIVCWQFSMNKYERSLLAPLLKLGRK